MSNKSPRRRAREFAMQGIYQWLLNDSSVSLIEEHLAQAPEYELADQELLAGRLRGAISNATALDLEIAPLIDRRVSELSPVEHAVLLLAAQELSHHPEVPYRVVINEAIELTKAFGGTEGHRFVNGVLDKLAVRLRATETNAATRKRS